MGNILPVSNGNGEPCAMQATWELRCIREERLAEGFVPKNVIRVSVQDRVGKRPRILHFLTGTEEFPTQLVKKGRNYFIDTNLNSMVPVARLELSRKKRRKLWFDPEGKYSKSQRPPYFFYTQRKKVRLSSEKQN